MTFALMIMAIFAFKEWGYLLAITIAIFSALSTAYMVLQ